MITGSGPSTDLPTTSNAHDRSQNGGNDGFVVRFNNDLSSLLYASYLGGSNRDTPAVVYASQDGHVYVEGSTGSTDFPTTSGAFDTSYNGGDNDAFVALFDTSGDGGGGGEPPANEIPLANAGADQAVNSYNTMCLGGRGSSEPDGSIVNY